MVTRYRMKKFKVIFYLLFIILVVNFSCGKDSNIVSNDTDGQMDGKTSATPNNGGFYPAGEGPIRSIYGEPVFDVDTLQLRMAGLVDSACALSWTDIQKLSSVTTDTMIML